MQPTARREAGRPSPVALVLVSVAASLAGTWAAKAVTRCLDAGRGSMSRGEYLGLVLHRESDRRLSPLAVWVMRRTRGSLARLYHVEALVLTTTGRRSGQRRSVVLQSFADGDAFVVVGTNDGGERPPAWYLNLAAEPMAEIEARGTRTAVRATELPPDEAAEWWRRIVERSPDYERYARATGRSFPVMRLEPVHDAG
jgi:deazaflavin-dependent oxidoreductase (nitroreductase family)